ncbi:DUF3810 domain-containing protein [Epilithonimonas hungarica]|uniref:DUF3810 domain-containing protein n=1 Tax=Epilithonimonas hungarica TaxID=454006 RepID=A0A1G7GQJ9_9FLAO|nr:DUF3810 domain-containing protein [Epilithonimonas hungarica]SDE90386.1 Protein of unknown function [Epilithonimonas hungarica]
MDTKKNIFIKNKLWAIILVAQFLLFYILSKSDFAINFFSNLFEWKKNFHVSLFSKFRFSIGDVIYTVVLLFLVHAIINLIRKKNSLTLKRLLIFVNIFYFVYQCCWGMLYFQPLIIKKLSTKEIEINDSDLKNIAIKYLKLCKETRERVSEDKNGVFKIKHIQNIEYEILSQQNQLPNYISTKKPISILSVKPSLYDNFMNYTGILGYYNPFTAESQFNPNLPSTNTPFTLAHEMSHQLGYAREQEASFIAYLCAKNSKNEDLQYSAQLYVLKSLLRALSKNDSNKDFVLKLISQYSEKMQKDRKNELEFYEKNEGIISDFFGVTNDLFLKTNQQDGRITYSYFINLLFTYETKKESY